MALMPYYFDDETESAAEKWCWTHKVAVPKVRSYADALHFTGKSRYRVERAFNEVSPYLRTKLLKWAGIDITPENKNADMVRSLYLINRYSRGNKLAQFNDDGKRKIANALYEVRELSKSFPQGITASEFLQIDKWGEEDAQPCQ
nr:MAG TPA: hypothetical protein [Caudoviricetes sp.]